MRRQVSAVIGMIAVAVLAACSTDQPSHQPLLPTAPSLAASQQCKNSLANNIKGQIDQLYNGAEQTTLETAFATIQSACPSVTTEDLLGFIQLVIDNSIVPNRNGTYAQGVVNLWSSVVLFVTNQTQSWSPDVVRGDSLVGGVPDGGAQVLYPGDNMTTFDGQAGLSLPSGPAPVTPTGPHLFTFQQVAASLCDAGTSLRLNGRCYEINDYPDGGTYSPPATLTLCLHGTSVGVPTGIGHAKNNFGTEVLPEVTPASTFSCAHDAETALGSFLRQAGPLGRAFASAYDYLRPKSLFAEDAGESGSIGSFSLAGGIYNEIFSDNFDDPDEFNDGVDTPDIGDAWTINSVKPGYIQIVNGVVTISQGQGACNNCPVFRLLGTRVNSNQDESIGQYTVSWTSTQTKPTVKDAPFVILNKTGGEIARLSYVTVSNQNRLMFSVNGGTAFQVGSWLQNVAQTFTVTVNLDMLNTALKNKVSLAIDGIDVGTAQGIAASRATSLLQIGYVLTKQDAGIMTSDNWVVTRLPDIPPP